MRDVLSSYDDTECVCCHNDTHPKATYNYSSDNSVDIEPIPPTLMLSFYGIVFLIFLFKID